MLTRETIDVGKFYPMPLMLLSNWNVARKVSGSKHHEMCEDEGPPGLCYCSDEIWATCEGAILADGLCRLLNLKTLEFDDELRDIWMSHKKMQQHFPRSE